MTFKGTSALVCGAGGGIGLATARALLDAGGRVLLTDIDGEELAAATANLESEHAAHLVVDVRDPESCREAPVGWSRSSASSKSIRQKRPMIGE